MSQSDRRVVITGMGLISPLGNSIAELWESLSTGRSGVDKIHRLPTDHLPSDVGGEASAFSGEIENFGEMDKLTKRAIKKGLKLMCREIQMGVAAAQLALANAGLQAGSVEPTRIGTMFGSDYIITEPIEFAMGVKDCLRDDGQFHFEDWGKIGRLAVEPLWLLKYLPNMPASHVAIYNDLRGPSNSITVREASSNLAIAEATTTIRRGTADVMVAGATGSRIQTLRTIHVSMQEQLADRHSSPANGDPAKACRPYDANRTGIVLGEGAGVVVLEELSSAEKRGANILGEVIGYGSSAVASRKGVADFNSAFKNIIKSTMKSGNLKKEDVGHIQGHGVSAVRCDREEAAAIHEFFGKDVAVTSAKSYMGNLGAGSGVVEMITSLVGLQNGQINPTINHLETDSECPIQVATQPISDSKPVFLNLNVTPQGQASAIAVRSW